MIVSAELRDKGIFDVDPDTGELKPTKKRGKIPAAEREISLLFLADPCNERSGSNHE